jgi:DNA-directed RNA polymerase subunit RPC12/RpoP
MAPPRKERSGPGIATPQDRLNDRDTATAAKPQGTPARSVRGRKAARQRPPLAPASVFGPVGRRKSWWYTYRCANCGAYLFGRAKSLDAVTGERRAGCGHRVQVVAARIYTQPGSGVAA